MLNWFKNNEIERIRLIETGWELTEKNSDIKVWENETGDILSLNFFNKAPDIPYSLNQINGVRDFYRSKIMEACGGIIKVEVITINNLPVVECLIKIPMQPSGMLYLGSLTFPFRDKKSSARRM